MALVGLAVQALRRRTLPAEAPEVELDLPGGSTSAGP
jgi:hypothetical protein